MEQKASILIYQTEDGTAMTEVRLAAETVWLRQEQMAQLFGRERSVIGKHLHNVFAEGELDEKSNVQNLHIAGSDKPVRFYNLDVIISIGYRVKSQQGTRFRQWATRTLREHLTQGYTLNRQRLESNARELEAALLLVKKAAQSPALLADTGRGLVDIVTRYAQTFLLLQRYDEGLLAEPPEQQGGVLPTPNDARAALSGLKADLLSRGEATDLFARERGDALPPCWAISTRAYSAHRPTLVWKPRPRTCCISPSRITRLPTATNAVAPSCLWIFSTATAACSTTPASR